MLHDMILDESAHEKWEAACPVYKPGMTYFEFIDGYKYPGLRPFNPIDFYTPKLNVEDPRIREDGSGGVCSRRFLKGFGEVQAVTNDNNYRNDGGVGDSAKAFAGELMAAVKKHDYKWVNHPSGDQFLVKSMAWIEAVTSTGQPWAYRMLTELGFKKIGPFKKMKHPETMTYMWLMTGADLVKVLKARTKG